MMNDLKQNSFFYHQIVYLVALGIDCVVAEAPGEEERKKFKDLMQWLQKERLVSKRLGADTIPIRCTIL